MAQTKQDPSARDYLVVHAEPPDSEGLIEMLVYEVDRDGNQIGGFRILTVELLK